jgi:hypothetical protein
MLRRLWIFVLAVAALIFFLFFWLIPSLSRFVSMTFSFMDLEPTMKLSWSDVHKILGMCSVEFQNLSLRNSDPPKP